MTDEPYQAIIFDTFGVTLVPSPRYLEDPLVEAIDAAARTTTDEARLWGRTGRKLGISAAEVAEVQGRWARKFCRNLNVWATLPELRRGARLVLLHGGPPSLVPHWAAQHGLEPAFERIELASEHGAAVDEPALYTRVAAALGLEPSACLLVDDELAPVEAARAAGLAAYRYGSAYGLLQSVRAGREHRDPVS